MRNLCIWFRDKNMAKVRKIKIRLITKGKRSVKFIRNFRICSVQIYIKSSAVWNSNRYALIFPAMNPFGA